MLLSAAMTGRIISVFHQRSGPAQNITNVFAIDWWPLPHYQATPLLPRTDSTLPTIKSLSHLSFPPLRCHNSTTGICLVLLSSSTIAGFPVIILPAAWRCRSRALFAQKRATGAEMEAKAAFKGIISHFYAALSESRLNFYMVVRHWRQQPCHSEESSEFP